MRGSLRDREPVWGGRNDSEPTAPTTRLARALVGLNLDSETSDDAVNKTVQGEVDRASAGETEAASFEVELAAVHRATDAEPESASLQAGRAGIQ